MGPKTAPSGPVGRGRRGVTLDEVRYGSILDVRLLAGGKREYTRMPAATADVAAARAMSGVIVTLRPWPTRTPAARAHASPVWRQ